jgi:ribosome-associated protein
VIGSQYALLRITPALAIPDDELSVHFARSGGPGGQNVNKVATKCELRFALARSRVLDAGVKARLCARYPAHVTEAGEFRVASDRTRSQAQNRADAEAKLVGMVRSVLAPPKPRKQTRVPRAERRRRLEKKRRRGETKRLRRAPDREA